MKAIVITENGGPEVLKLQELPIPKLSSGQVLIRIKAAGVNRSDVISRKGGYQETVKGKIIPGLEVSGLIESCSENVSRWKIGDHVCAIIHQGGYADYVAVDSNHCLPVPTDLTFEQAASLPEAILTVWYNIFKSASLKPKEKLLVHGGSSGIGITAIQLTKIFGSEVFATAGSEEKCIACEELGATKCVNYKQNDFEIELKQFGIDVILDIIGGDYTDKNIRLLNTDGRLVFINAMGGVKSSFNILEIMTKRIIITGSMLKPRSAQFKTDLVQEVLSKVWPAIESGDFKPVINKVFPLNEAAEAHRLMESSKHIGKIILKTD